MFHQIILHMDLSFESKNINIFKSDLITIEPKKVVWYLIGLVG
jgi:hypothetical protein